MTGLDMRCLSLRIDFGCDAYHGLGREPLWHREPVSRCSRLSYSVQLPLRVSTVAAAFADGHGRFGRDAVRRAGRGVHCRGSRGPPRAQDQRCLLARRPAAVNGGRQAGLKLFGRGVMQRPALARRLVCSQPHVNRPPELLASISWHRGPSSTTPCLLLLISHVAATKVCWHTKRWLAGSKQTIVCTSTSSLAAGWRLAAAPPLRHHGGGSRARGSAHPPAPPATAAASPHPP